jgi:hypothetical protein
MKRHRIEPIGVNTMRANNRTDYKTQSFARVCPEEANTSERALATADLVRDAAFTKA